MKTEKSKISINVQFIYSHCLSLFRVASEVSPQQIGINTLLRTV
jgi:hypothetical protein